MGWRFLVCKVVQTADIISSALGPVGENRRVATVLLTDMSLHVSDGFAAIKGFDGSDFAPSCLSFSAENSRTRSGVAATLHE